MKAVNRTLKIDPDSRNDIDSTPKTVKVNKCRKDQRNEKEDLINQKLKNKKSNR